MDYCRDASELCFQTRKVLIFDLVFCQTYPHATIGNLTILRNGYIHKEKTDTNN